MFWCVSVAGVSAVEEKKVTFTFCVIRTPEKREKGEDGRGNCFTDAHLNGSGQFWFGYKLFRPDAKHLLIRLNSSLSPDRENLMWQSFFSL